MIWSIAGWGETVQLNLSRMVSETARVVQPNIRRAFSDETCRGFPSSYSRPRATGSKIAITRTRKSGTEIDGTFRALSPNPCLRILAMSAIQ